MALTRKLRPKSLKRCISYLDKLDKHIKQYKKKEKAYTQKILKIQKDFMKIHTKFHHKYDDIKKINASDCIQYPEFTEKINDMKREGFIQPHYLMKQLIDHHSREKSI
jgi:hypothetical protein